MDAICARSALASRGVDEGISFDKKNPLSRSLTHQSFAKDADINNIMAKYAVSGVLVDPSNVDSGRAPRFGDFSDLVDYPTLVSRINQAQSDFMTPSSAVRAKFENSVEKCLEFISEPENVVEAVKLGLLPESTIDSTFAVRPDLATDEWKAAQLLKGVAVPKATPTAPTVPNDSLPPAGK